MTQITNGRCLCGAIGYAVHGELAPIEVCHCSQCRLAQGGPFATNIPVKESAFVLQCGQDFVQKYESTPGKFRCFCRQCGSPLYSQRDALPGVLRLRAGTLEGEVASRLGLHAHVGSKANWWPAMNPDAPIAVVQAQLDAYNAKDIDGLLQTYAPDAEQFTLHGELLAQGHAQMRARYLTRFAEPDLHAKLLSRTVVGNVVTDVELVTRNFPEGRGTIEMLCVFDVVNGHIQKASFVVGEKTLTDAAAGILANLTSS